MANRHTLGGVIHAYQQYDPKRFPSPTQPPPDMASAAFEHMLMYGQRRELTPEELARAVRIDPSQISGLGPSDGVVTAATETDGLRSGTESPISAARATSPPRAKSEGSWA